MDSLIEVAHMRNRSTTEFWKIKNRMHLQNIRVFPILVLDLAELDELD